MGTGTAVKWKDVHDIRNIPVRYMYMCLSFFDSAVRHWDFDINLRIQKHQIRVDMHIHCLSFVNGEVLVSESLWSVVSEVVTDQPVQGSMMMLR